MPANEFAAKVKVRPLIVASRIDKRVPYESSLNLADEFSQDSIVMTLNNTEHGDVPEDAMTLAYIRKYLNR